MLSSWYPLDIGRVIPVDFLLVGGLVGEFLFDSPTKTKVYLRFSHVLVEAADSVDVTSGLASPTKLVASPSPFRSKLRLRSAVSETN